MRRRKASIGVLAVLAATFVLLAAACDSLIGLDTPQAAPSEAEAGDGAAGDDGADATAEGAPGDDAGTLGDADGSGAGEGGNLDAGGCVPVPPTSPTGSGCGGSGVSDGSCSPGFPMAGGPTFIVTYAAPEHRSYCTTTDITTVYTECISRGLTTEMQCAQVFSGLGALNVCTGCLFDGFGPFLYDPSYAYYYVNVPGCIALEEPCNATCAQDLATTWSCTASSCAYVCEGAGATNPDLVACESAAETCECLSDRDISQPCVDAIQQRASPATFCLSLAPAIQSYGVAPSLTASQMKSLMTLFCGGA